MRGERNRNAMLKKVSDLSGNTFVYLTLISKNSDVNVNKKTKKLKSSIDL